MATHVKVLGVLYLALSALSLLAALFILLAIGGAAATVGVTADPEDAAAAIPILGLAGTALGMLLLLFSLPGIVTGWGLLYFKPWARVLGIVLSALNILNIPLGTILGGVWPLGVVEQRDRGTLQDAAQRSFDNLRSSLGPA